MLEWHVSEGDAVAEGDTVIEVSTDKIDAEVPAPVSGTITKLLVSPDDTVQVGQALAEIAAGAAPEQRATSNEEPAASTATTAPAPAPADASSDGDAKASPVARRVAASKGVDLGSVSGSGPGGKVVKGDVIAAAGNGASASGRRGRPARRSRSAARRRCSPRRWTKSRSVPTATSFRTLPVDTLDAKRKAINGALKDRGMKVSFTHLVAWAIVRAGVEWPVMGRSYVRDRRQAAGDREPERQPRDRGRRRAQGRAQPDGPLHQGRRGPRLRELPRLLRGPDHQDAREQAHRRRLPGHQHLAHQPGRARHRRLGPEAARRAGHDRRHRLDRLSGRMGPRAGREDQGARGLEGDDDDLHLRPPDHPGRRVGLVPAPDRPATAGRGRLLRVGRRAARDPHEPRHQRAPRLGLGAPAVGRRRRRAEHRRRRRARPRAAAGGAGGDLSAQGLPHARPSGRQRQPARRRAEGRPGARARERQPDPGAHVADSRVHPADRGRRRDVARLAAADARRLLLDDRVPDRAPLLASTADVVARDDRDRLAPGTARRRREAVAALAPARGVPVRAVPAEGLPGPEDVLDRGPRRDRADARRDRHPGAPERAPRRS